MIEEIREELRLFNCGFNTSDRVIKCHNNILKILDKYNNQPDYKSAWNELKNKTNEELKQATWAGAGLNDTKISMQELEQKYKLGGE